jgi:hypothetical protein
MHLFKVSISFSLHFLYRKKTKQNLPAGRQGSRHGLKMKSLSSRTMPTRTKADKTSFRTTRGLANTHGEFLNVLANIISFER